LAKSATGATPALASTKAALVAGSPANVGAGVRRNGALFPLVAFELFEKHPLAGSMCCVKGMRKDFAVIE
jgi:hypothetical protein